MLLKVDTVSKSYGEKCVLDKFTVEFKNGIYGILGPNGAGKSTLMNILTDNIRRDEGSITVDGVEILDMGKRYRELIGYMPQEQGLYGAMSARKYLYYVAALKGLKKGEAKRQVEELLQVVGLNLVAHKKIKEFSGGMRQRTMLAGALLADPKIIILDEPTAGLDPKERIKIRNFIAKLSMNRIVLIATHVVSDIECIAKKVLLLKEGRLIEIDTPYKLIERVSDKAWEKECREEEIIEYQEKYGIGNVFQKENGITLRVMQDECPKDFEKAKGNIGLEDVYLYYMEGENRLWQKQKELSMQNS